MTIREFDLPAATPAAVAQPVEEVALHPVLRQLFEAWQNAGMRWCLLRVPRQPAASRGDVDLLVDPADLPAVRRIGTSLGFVAVPRSGPDVHLVSYDLPTGRWLWLHIVTELAFGPNHALRTAAASGCVERRQAAGPYSLMTLAPEDAFWVTLLHCLLDKGRIAAHHRVSLRAWADCACADHVLAAQMEGAGLVGMTAGQVLESARQGTWDALEDNAGSLRAAWMARAGIGPEQLLAGSVRGVLDQALHARRRRGLSVALLGPDGAGKSTLVAALKDSSVFPVKSIYMGLTWGYLRYVDRLRIPVVVQLGRVVILWSRYLLALCYQARGHLVVFDRYIYDAMVPHPKRLNWLQKLTRWIDGRACPAPDLILLLDAPGEVMYRRKKEYTPELLEDWRQHFLALRHRVTNLHMIDATQPKEVVQAEVNGYIWRWYARRWKQE